MEHKFKENQSTLLLFGTALALWFVELLVFLDKGMKPIVLIVGILTVALLLLCDVRRLNNVSTFLWAGYIAFTGFSGAWAMSGKFFLMEFIKPFLAFCIFLYLVRKPTMDRGVVRRVLLVLAMVAAVVAVLSVEAASTGLVKELLQAFSDSYRVLNVAYLGRLYGIYGNPNVEASVYALGILAALACMSSASSKGDRITATVLCSLNAFAFLLCISVGATMCFALAVVVYLIVAGRDRVNLLLRMLFVAVPTMLFAVVAVPFFNGSGVLKVLPLLLMAANAAVSVLLELRLMTCLSAVMEKHAKLPFVLLGTIVVLIAVYCVAALNVTGPYRYNQSGEMLRRVDYTPAGTHTVEIQADGDVKLEVTSQTRREILLETFPTVLEQENVANQTVTFTVPENSAICFYNVFAEPGVTVSSISIDGGPSLPLKYPLLPSFVANRLQGATRSSSLIIRQALWDYGMRLFRMSPVIGNGYGAYECGIIRVEDFFFESKYVHNHYIEVLLCTGVIGFVLYMAAMVSMAVLLVKKRRIREDEDLGWVYPMLVSVLVMVSTITLWDISMSRAIYICMVFAFYGVLVRLLAKPLFQPKIAEAALSKKEKADFIRKQEDQAMLMRLGWALLPALFLITLGGNMVAGSLVNRPVATYDDFFANLKTAAEIDLYEYNDAKLSYVMGVLNDEAMTETYLDQANIFAEEMMAVQSNAIPRFMEEYYIATGQYEKAIEAAQRSAVYSAADPDTWNIAFVQLWTGVILNAEALAENFDTLLPGLIAYKDMFDQRNATALDKIELEEPALSAYNVINEMDQRMKQGDRQGAVDFLQELLDSYNKAVEEAIANGET